MNTPTPTDFHFVQKLELLRLENGWLVRHADDSFLRNSGFVFESTKSLAAHLPRLLGESKWKLSELPERDEKGHFKKTP